MIAAAPICFRANLLAALKIVQRGDLPLRDLIGAFAGEIGQTQFLPSSYIKYGVDFDGDGRVDLRHSVPDVLASTANLLHTNGFKMGAPYGEGSANFEAMREWNHATDLPQDHRVFRGSAGGKVGRNRCRRSGTDSAYRGSFPVLCVIAGASRECRRYKLGPGVRRATTTYRYFPAFVIFSIRRASHRPIGRRAKPLQQVHQAGVVADQDARLVFLDALDDAQRGGLRRGLGDRIEPLDRFRAAGIVGHAGAGAGIAGDVGGNAAGMHHRKPNRARRHLQARAAGFRKAAHREFRRGVSGLARRRDDAEDAREVDDVGFALAAPDAAGTRACRAPRPRN